jgi:hypothetical protein
MFPLVVHVERDAFQEGGDAKRRRLDVPTFVNLIVTRGELPSRLNCEPDAVTVVLANRAIVLSKKDVSRVLEHRWKTSNKYMTRTSDGVSLSHFLMGWKDDGKLVVDHIDKDEDNNCISNLRVATRPQNSQNSKKKKGTRSRFIGVTWHARAGKWRARSRFNKDKKETYLGMFHNERAAAYAYNKYVQAYFPDSQINRLEPGETYEVPDIKPMIKTGVRNNGHGHFVARWTVNGKRLTKTCCDIEEAEEQVDKWKQEEETRVLDERRSKITVNGNVASMQVGDKVALFDADKIEVVIQHAWLLEAHGYVLSYTGSKPLMERLVYGKKIPLGHRLIHINHVRHDNRLENLREATHSTNAHHKVKKAGTLSKYWGIVRAKHLWRARIKHNHKTHQSSKRYKTEEEAARAYDEMAKKYYGAHANLNFPDAVDVEPIQ